MMATQPKQRMRKSSIKKWEQTYTVPIPYFGLMQIERDTHSSNYGNTENDTHVQYWGSIEKVFEGIPIAVSVSIWGEIKYFDIGNTHGMYDDDISEEEYYRIKNLSEDNRSGASVASYTGRVVIRDPSTDSDHSASYYNYIVGTGRDYGGPDFGGFMSIEDAINHVGEVVEDFFPKVMEYVNQEKMASTKKSQKVSSMAKGKAVKKSTADCLAKIQEALDRIDVAMTDIFRVINGNDDEWADGGWTRQNVNSALMTLFDGKGQMQEAIDIFNSTGKSTKKSKYARLHKALNKIGGFTKEDEEEIEIDDDDVVEIEDDEDGDGKVVEIESEETHAEEVADGEESESDNLNESCKDCKSSKAFRTSKRVKMKKGEDMPADADDFENDNQKGSGNAGSELPEDADDQQDENDPGSGNAGKELPEDADDQEDQKQARARKNRMMRSRKNVRKFSVTDGGSPDQTSYNQRYQQSPMVRNAIDGHFTRTEKSFDEVAMMQERLDAMNKSKRNKTNNGVPQNIRRR